MPYLGKQPSEVSSVAVDTTTGTFSGEVAAASLDISGNVDVDGVLETDALSIASTTITSTAAELNIMDGVTATAAELNIMDGVTSTTAELNILDGVTSTAAELNLLDGVSGLVQADLTKLAAVDSTAAELNILDGVTSTAAELNILDGVTSTAAELNLLDGVTSTTAELNILDGVTSTATELNLLDGVTSTTAELNILDGVTSTAAELNILDGVTSTTAELNALDGITAVVGELNALDIGSTAVGTAVASKAVILDSSKDYTGIRNLTITGELDAATLDISGNIDVDGTTNLDAVDIDGAVDMASTLGVTGKITADAGIDIDNINIDGTTIALSSGDLTLDVAGDITLDAGGGDIILKDDGTEFGNIANSSSDLQIVSIVSDKDIIFRGNDGGSFINALTLDMSAGGNAIFNAGLAIGGTGAANTLDDYETGTFTGVGMSAASGGAFTITSQDNEYVKVGKSVILRIKLIMNTPSSASGNITLTGLPFASTGVFGMRIVYNNQSAAYQNDGGFFISGTSATKYAYNTSFQNLSGFNIWMEASYIGT